VRHGTRASKVEPDQAGTRQAPIESARGLPGQQGVGGREDESPSLENESASSGSYGLNHGLGVAPLSFLHEGPVSAMSLLGNIIWLIFGGLIAGLGYILGGIGLCLTLIGIPFGLQSIKLGIAVMAPFGKELVELNNADSVLRIIFNVIWLALFGWPIALAHLTSAALLAVTIIGIPFALQHIKLIPLSLFPFGRDLRAL
jgi:uncharacterized membrane protein YccF (DUF307 family)